MLKSLRVLILTWLLLVGATALISAVDTHLAYAQTQDSDGDGGDDNIDSCPNQAGPRDNNFCPRPDVPAPDRDGDGVADFVDQCPDLPATGFTQGCPPPTPTPARPAPVVTDVSIVPNLEILMCAIRNISDRSIPIVVDPSLMGELDTYVGVGHLVEPDDFGGQTGELQPGETIEAQFLVENYPFYNPDAISDDLWATSVLVPYPFYLTENGYVLTTYLASQVEEVGAEPCARVQAHDRGRGGALFPTLVPPTPQSTLVAQFDPSLLECTITNTGEYEFIIVADPSLPGQLVLVNEGHTNYAGAPHQFGGVMGTLAPGQTMSALYHVNGYPFWFDRIEDENPASVFPFGFWVTENGYVLDLGGPTSPIEGGITCPEVQHGAPGTHSAGGPEIDNNACYIVNYRSIPLQVVQHPSAPGQLTAEDLFNAQVVSPTDYDGVVDTLGALDVRPAQAFVTGVPFNFDVQGDDLGGVLSTADLWFTGMGYAVAVYPRIAPVGIGCQTYPAFNTDLTLPQPTAAPTEVIISRIPPLQRLDQCIIRNDSTNTMIIVTDPSLPGGLINITGLGWQTVSYDAFGGWYGNFAPGQSMPALYYVDGYPFWFDDVGGGDMQPAMTLYRGFYVTEHGFVLDIGADQGMITEVTSCEHRSAGDEGVPPHQGTIIPQDANACAVVNYQSVASAIVVDPHLPGQVTSAFDWTPVNSAADYGGVTSSLAPYEIRPALGYVQNYPFYFDYPGNPNPPEIKNAARFYVTADGYVLDSRPMRTGFIGNCARIAHNGERYNPNQPPIFVTPTPVPPIQIGDFDPTILTACQITNTSQNTYAIVSNPTAPGQLVIGENGVLSPSNTNDYSHVVAYFEPGETIPAWFLVTDVPLWFDYANQPDPAYTKFSTLWSLPDGYLLALNLNGQNNVGVQGSFTCSTYPYGTGPVIAMDNAPIDPNVCQIMNMSSTPVDVVVDPALIGQITTADPLTMRAASPAEFGGVTLTLYQGQSIQAYGYVQDYPFNFDVIGDDLGGVQSVGTFWVTPSGYLLRVDFSGNMLRPLGNCHRIAWGEGLGFIPPIAQQISDPNSGVCQVRIDSSNSGAHDPTAVVVDPSLPGRIDLSSGEPQSVNDFGGVVGVLIANQWYTVDGRVTGYPLYLDIAQSNDPVQMVPTDFYMTLDGHYILDYFQLLEHRGTCAVVEFTP